MPVTFFLAMASSRHYQSLRQVLLKVKHTFCQRLSYACGRGKHKAILSYDIFLQKNYKISILYGKL